MYFSLGLAFPENVRAVEEECGLQQLVNVSWEVSIMMLYTPKTVLAGFREVID